MLHGIHTIHPDANFLDKHLHVESFFARIQDFLRIISVFLLLYTMRNSFEGLLP